jgi:hypothetical protein
MQTRTKLLTIALGVTMLFALGTMILAAAIPMVGR